MNNKSYWLTQDQIDDLLDVLVNAPGTTAVLTISENKIVITKGE